MKRIVPIVVLSLFTVGVPIQNASAMEEVKGEKEKKVEIAPVPVDAKPPVGESEKKEGEGEKKDKKDDEKPASHTGRKVAAFITSASTGALAYHLWKKLEVCDEKIKLLKSFARTFKRDLTAEFIGSPDAQKVAKQLRKSDILEKILKANDTLESLEKWRKVYLYSTIGSLSACLLTGGYVIIPALIPAKKPAEESKKTTDKPTEKKKEGDSKNPPVPIENIVGVYAHNTSNGTFYEFSTGFVKLLEKMAEKQQVNGGNALGALGQFAPLMGMLGGQNGGGLGGLIGGGKKDAPKGNGGNFNLDEEEGN